MPDREKVIEGLRCIKGDLILCVNCAYSDENGHGTHSCKAFCANDAIALLKEQEAKTGKWIEQDGYDGDVYYDCSACGESWVMIDGTPQENGMLYCPHCGAKMEAGEEG